MREYLSLPCKPKPCRRRIQPDRQEKVVPGLLSTDREREWCLNQYVIPIECVSISYQVEVALVGCFVFKAVSSTLSGLSNHQVRNCSSRVFFTHGTFSSAGSAVGDWSIPMHFYPFP
jgi:hypothetical protein